MQAGHPDVDHQVGLASQVAAGEQRFAGDRQVGGAGADDQDLVAGRFGWQGRPGRQPGGPVDCGVRQHGGDGVQVLGAAAGEQGGLVRAGFGVPVPVPLGDQANLLGGLTGAQHRLGVAAPGPASEIDLGDAVQRVSHGHAASAAEG